MAVRSVPVRSKPAKNDAKKMTTAKLLKLAEKHRPPQSWFDQTDVPFTPTKE